MNTFAFRILKAVQNVTYNSCRLISQSTTANFRVSTIFRDKQQAEMDQLKENPFYAKYASKIATLQRTSPEEFLSKLEAKNVTSKPKSKLPFSGMGRPKPDITHSAKKAKKLDSVLKLDLIQDKTVEELSEIWRDYHVNQENKIAAVIPKDTYGKILGRAEKFPLFLYPVPRAEGYEFVVAEFSGHECHFTTLINYQAYKENAPECLCIIHYPDLQEKKGIVLMHGEYDKNVLIAKEAQCLANQLQLYYTASETERKFHLLKTFSADPDSFRHMDLVEELQSLVVLGK